MSSCRVYIYSVHIVIISNDFASREAAFKLFIVKTFPSSRTTTSSPLRSRVNLNSAPLARENFAPQKLQRSLHTDYYYYSASQSYIQQQYGEFRRVKNICCSAKSKRNLSLSRMQSEPLGLFGGSDGVSSYGGICRCFS